MSDRTWTVRELVSELETDDWRQETPFSHDVAECHAVVLSDSTSVRQKTDALCEWLSKHQPCLFGQMEAKRRRLDFCVLTEKDLAQSDDHIRCKIQDCRINWKRRAFTGGSHGFLIVALSSWIANARPNYRLHALATRLCELYVDKGDSDKIQLDDLLMELRRDGITQWRRWMVGINYFGAQADRRWWHDHRIPGGMAFSMNSGGHMSRTIAEEALSRNSSIGSDDVPRNSLVYWALPKAMKTIGPRVAESKRATWLGERGHCSEDAEPPTYEQRARYFGELARYSENAYFGRYHTDHTIPSDYFEEGLWEEKDLQSRERSDLYFTYLHQPKDSDYRAMGLGNEIEPNGDTGESHDI
jgi:hypothetical protein